MAGLVNWYDSLNRRYMETELEIKRDKNIYNADGYLASISNALVCGSYTMTLLEKRLLMLFISTINNDPKNPVKLDCNTAYAISVKTYSDLYEIDYEAAKDELSRAVEKLYQQDLWYFDENGDQRRTRWISTLPRYNKYDHMVEIMLAPGIIPLISELSRSFTSYKITYLAGLTSFYSLRLYELFYMELKRSHKSNCKLNVSVLFLRQLFKLDKKYPDFGVMFSSVVREQIEEINQKTDIYISYLNEYGDKMYIKEGRKVVAITFIISHKPKEKLICSH